jgi:pyruvate/2-oxoglutarate dehydrogenase complex dihydrolipoamide dehydrogenase (E3) component
VVPVVPVDLSLDLGAERFEEPVEVAAYYQSRGHHLEGHPGSVDRPWGGAVGCEMSQVYASLGSRVTLIEAEPCLLCDEEPFAGRELAEAMAQSGIDVRLGVRAEQVERSGAVVRLAFSDGASIEAEELLVATGRRPRTHDLGLETVGLEHGGAIASTRPFRALGKGWLYAIGDVDGIAALTHMGKYQAHVASQAILGGPANTEPAPVTRVVFTEPQVASVGTTLEAALAAGVNADAYDAPTSGTAGALFHGRDTPGAVPAGSSRR